MRPLDMLSAVVLECGEESARVAPVETGLLLTVGDETFEMRQTQSAFGERYEAVGDSTTFLWNKGERTTIAVRGRTLTECVPANGTSRVFRAQGNEPFWSLQIAGAALTFRTPDGDSVSVQSAREEHVDGGRRFTAISGGERLVATILDDPCADSMSGMSYPSTVTVRVHGREYHGCGGEPARLLQGAGWIVEEIDGTDVIVGSRVTLSFGPDGRVAGRASCNSYSGQYALTGEGLTVSKILSTRMACDPPSVMTQEATFLDVLGNVQRFDFDPEGALILHAADGRMLKARRDAAEANEE